MSKKNKFKKNHCSGSSTPKKNKDNTSESKTSRAKRLPKTLGTVIMVLLAIWGGSWVTVKPRIFVHPGAALDPNNPANTPFVVDNQGYLSIHDVNFICSMKDITFPGKIRAIAQVPYHNSFSTPQQVAKVIAPGEQYTILLPFIFMEHNKIEESDIAVELTFKPIKWLPWRCKTKHRFVSAHSKDGQWHWFPQPIDK